MRTRETKEHETLLALLFLISGCAALIYEVIWLQLLRLVIGASAISVGILLASFMVGMFLGSLASSRWIPRTLHPIRVYARLELGVGILGLLLPWFVLSVGDVYLRHASLGLQGILLRAAIAGICLLPPTILMGATFPAVSRWFVATPRGLSGLGVLYAANLVGAVTGALLAGFYLLPVYDVRVATGVAAALNFIAGAAGLALARRAPHEPRPALADPGSPGSGEDRVVLLVIALSGMTALGGQVIWTRLLALLFGGTSYTFAIILAVFLACLGIGSALASARI
ncbi:MAG: SAM-dependent methyltransferase, partial [Acidobacteria bacterium]|nr:SAM-dependent methyltransferase [Acidobacteriota bacterium]